VKALFERRGARAVDISPSHGTSRRPPAHWLGAKCQCWLQADPWGAYANQGARLDAGRRRVHSGFAPSRAGAQHDAEHVNDLLKLLRGSAARGKGSEAGSLPRRLVEAGAGQPGRNQPRRDGGRGWTVPASFPVIGRWAAVTCLARAFPKTSSATPHPSKLPRRGRRCGSPSRATVDGGPAGLPAVRGNKKRESASPKGRSRRIFHLPASAQRKTNIPGEPENKSGPRHLQERLRFRQPRAAGSGFIDREGRGAGGQPSNSGLAGCGQARPRRCFMIDSALGTGGPSKKIS